ncbi:MAG: chemotaxis protein CheB, partial [Polyangiales bacterium]
MTDAEATTTARMPLVVIGSSAGGIEALATFVAGLPADFPAPIVIAQHLDPARPSGLAAILDRRSPLPVVTIEAHTKLEAGHVYIAPSNRHVAILDGHVELEGDHRDRPRPSIDLLLSTAAKAYGERLFAVILTGSGSDGATGAVEVKEAGGTIVVQNPQTARYPSMPLALPPTIVDHVVDIEDLASLLDNLVRDIPLREQSPDDAQVAAILELVGRNSKIDFRAYKPTTILRRIARRMAVTRSKSLEEYRRFLEQNPAETAELVMAFLIKVTEFMRDPEAFEFLRATVLPTLIERARLGGKTLRFWSAGCATGEEPYSIAMVLADLLGAELSEWNIKIFATDLDDDAIAYARRGLYPSKLLEDLPAGYVERFFDPTDTGVQIAKPLRALVIFGQQDLSRAVPFPRVDLVLCRNVLIYFKPELQQHVLDQFSYSLHGTAGFLFLGKAETARPSKAVFELVDKKWKFYRCLHSPLLAAARSSGARANAAPRLAGGKPVEERSMTTTTEAGGAPLLRIDDMLLRSLPFGAVMVDRTYRISSINSAARSLLGIRDLSNHHDFLHAVRGVPYAQVRDAIDNAFRDRAPATLNELELDRMSNNEARYLSLTIMPMVRDNTVDLAAITVVDVTEHVLTRHRLEASQREQQQLVAELSGANKRYQEVNKDLQDANEELQA